MQTTTETKKISYNYRALTKQGFVLIVENLKKNVTNRQFEVVSKEFVNSFSGLLRSERLEIHNILTEQFRYLKHYVDDGSWKDLLCRDSRYDVLLRAARRAAAQKDIRVKFDAFYNATEQGYIFFLCDEHDNCGEDHVELQGKLYVDKNWRNHTDKAMWGTVLKFIQDRGIMTVQKVRMKPYWLTTRPYCRHRFLPIDTATVLSTPLNILKRRFPKKNRPVYTEADYDKFKREVYQALYNALPCSEFGRKVKKLTRKLSKSA